MNDEQIWSAIDTQRLSVAAVLDGLTEDQWAQASLCAGWTVRDVAAHLTLQQVGLGEALAGVIRHPALGMNRMILQMARRQSALPTDELTARIRGMVGSRKPNVGTTCREALIDALVHGQDITVRLGSTSPCPSSPRQRPPAACGRPAGPGTPAGRSPASASARPIWIGPSARAVTSRAPSRRSC